MKGGGSAVWSLMWKYCISVRTLRYQGTRVWMPLPGHRPGGGVVVHQAGQFAWALGGLRQTQPGGSRDGGQARPGQDFFGKTQSRRREGGEWKAGQKVCGHLSGTRSAQWRVPGARTVWLANSLMCVGTGLRYITHRHWARLCDFGPVSRLL